MSKTTRNQERDGASHLRHSSFVQRADHSATPDPIRLPHPLRMISDNEQQLSTKQGPFLRGLVSTCYGSPSCWGISLMPSCPLLLQISDIVDANHVVSGVLDRFVARHVGLAENRSFTVEGLVIANLNDHLAVGIENGPDGARQAPAQASDQHRRAEAGGVKTLRIDRPCTQDLRPNAS